MTETLKKPIHKTTNHIQISGYGLGLVGIIQLWQCVPLTFPILGLQIVFSQWWLARFRFGPLE